MGTKRTAKPQKSKPASQESSLDERMLEENLKRSYAERIRRHQIALATMQKLQKAKVL